MADSTAREFRLLLRKFVQSRSGIITVSIVMDSLKLPPSYWQRVYQTLEDMRIPCYGEEAILDKLPRAGREARYQLKEKA